MARSALHVTPSDRGTAHRTGHTQHDQDHELQLDGSRVSAPPVIISRNDT